LQGSTPKTTGSSKPLKLAQQEGREGKDAKIRVGD
jgi:hypothetical protein